MCGFAGYLSSSPINSITQSRSMIQAMTDSLVHRGPDSEGFWQNYPDGIVLGFRRLAILDTSSKGNQPMLSPNGLYVIVFNGEIYNHLDLRKEIQTNQPNKKWSSSSDTETLLCAFEQWGVEQTLKRSLGMFSFALWNTQKKVLTLGRDRLGEKPLYYGWQGRGDEQVFLFGSELKPFHCHSSFSKEIDRNSISSFLRHSYIPAPHSIYSGINKLLPGHIAEVSVDNPEPTIYQYWSASKSVIDNSNTLLFPDDASATDALEDTLKQSVSMQIIADVPIGAFLSGGIDSSAIVALMQEQSNQRIQTFTIGFNHKEFNEAEHGKAVAQHLNTDHAELYIDAQDLLDVVPSLPLLYDEPFGDSSQIPTYLISKFAKQSVTVALSGDGGDELFCGYNRYQITDKYWNKLQAVPPSFRKVMAKAILKLPPKLVEQLFNFLNQGQETYSNFADKILKGANVLSSKDIPSLYKRLISAEKNPNSFVIQGFETNEFLDFNLQAASKLDDLSLMMLLDMLTYLPDDILTKVDRAAMGVSLETRVPMLDKNVVEFAQNLSQDYKLRDGKSKWLLREVLYRYVPKELIERPKSGFAIPIGEWLRADLREWADELLNENILIDQRFFHPEKIRERWHQHLSGTHDWQHLLWNVLMFQSWYKNFHENS